MNPEPNTYPTPISVLIVDDHKLIRDGLKMMLVSLKKSRQFDIDEAEDGDQALKKLNGKDYHVIIIDYSMPGIASPEVVLRILRFKSNTKILVLSNYDDLVFIQNMIDAGVKGYVLKNIEPSQLLTAINTILENKMYYSNEIAVKLIDRVKDGSPVITTEGLTKREIEVLKLITLELNNEEIADRLSVSKRTIDAHRQNLLNKLNVKNTVGLIKAAYAFKFLD
ncbi:MAG TPA: response regulator transcription factor [Flavisolibacter sp.]